MPDWDGAGVVEGLQVAVVDIGELDAVCSQGASVADCVCGEAALEFHLNERGGSGVAEDGAPADDASPRDGALHCLWEDDVCFGGRRVDAHANCCGGSFGHVLVLRLCARKKEGRPWGLGGI